MLLRQVDVLTSEIEAGAFLVIHLVVNKLVDELDDGGASSVVGLARLEPVALLQVVADGEARHHHRPVLRLLLEPGNEGREPDLLVVGGALLAADPHLHKKVEVSWAKHFVVRLQLGGQQPQHVAYLGEVLVQVLLPVACPAVGAEAEHLGPSLLEPLVSGLQLLLQPGVLLLEHSVLFLQLLVFFAKLAQLNQLVSKDTNIDLLLSWILGILVTVGDFTVLVNDA